MKFFCNNVASVIYLCFVITKTNIWVKQITAAILMLVLFAVFFFQLSHSHSSVLVVPGKNKAPGFYCDKHTSNSTCFICDYQLTKDSDNSYVKYNIIYIAGLYTPTTVNYTFILQNISPVFETRGPPCI